MAEAATGSPMAARSRRWRCWPTGPGSCISIASTTRPTTPTAIAWTSSAARGRISRCSPTSARSRPPAGSAARSRPRQRRACACWMTSPTRSRAKRPPFSRSSRPCRAAPQRCGICGRCGDGAAVETERSQAARAARARLARAGLGRHRLARHLPHRRDPAGTAGRRQARPAPARRVRGMHLRAVGQGHDGGGERGDRDRPRRHRAHPAQRKAHDAQHRNRAAGAAVLLRGARRHGRHDGVRKLLNRQEAFMFLGLTVFTWVHTILSIVALIAGIVVVIGLFGSRTFDSWSALYFATAVATNVTGFFFFPGTGFAAARVVGVVSSVALAFAILARYVFHYRGAWRWIYAVGTVLGLYFLVFVTVAQAFAKVPALHRLAPTQTEPPFAYAQGVVLVIFVVLTIAAARTF